MAFCVHIMICHLLCVQTPCLLIVCELSCHIFSVLHNIYSALGTNTDLGPLLFALPLLGDSCILVLHATDTVVCKMHSVFSEGVLCLEMIPLFQTNSAHFCTIINMLPIAVSNISQQLNLTSHASTLPYGLVWSYHFILDF